MPIYALGDVEPDIHPEAFVHPDAVIIGDVTIGADSSIWPTAVVRGDGGPIRIGSGTNVQDGAIIHVPESLPTTIGDGVLIGHLAHLEGCTVHDRAFIGTASVVLHGVVIGEGAVVGGNAVVVDGTIVPAGALALGTPAKVREGGARPDMATKSALGYVANGRRYREQLRRIG